MTESLELIASEVGACTKCPLHKGRLQAVPGEGNANADILFIGEGPGAQEDKTGRPFVGASGQLLTEMLGSVGLKREDVFIANVVKCRPPGNRDPIPEEIEACRAYLDRQIALINPKVIVTLGRFSMARWFPDAKISKIHGQAKQIGPRLIVPFYHPAVALYNGSLRPQLEADFAKLPGYVAQAKAAEAQSIPSAEKEADQSSGEQLNLF